jgi:hypothetical protein
VKPPSPTTGVLGPLLVHPPTGRLFSLAAAQVVCGSEEVLVAGRSGKVQPISRQAPRIVSSSDDWQEAEALVAQVPLIKELHIQATAEGPVGRRILRARPEVETNIWRRLGQSVVVHGRRASAQGRLVSVDSHFEMPRPWDGKVATFDNALEIRREDDIPLVSKGDAGALVTGTDGAWLGIVVGCAGDIVFAAPIGALAHRAALVPLAATDIAAHNRQLKESGETPLGLWLQHQAVEPATGRPPIGMHEDAGLGSALDAACAAADRYLGEHAL